MNPQQNTDALAEDIMRILLKIIYAKTNVFFFSEFSQDENLSFRSKSQLFG